MTFTERNGISVAEIVVYSPILAIAILLGIRHGFTRSSGWVFLIIFSLLRIVGAGLQLGEISDPTNTGLYIGAAICQNIGFSPLLMTTIGLLARVWDSIQKQKPSSVVQTILRLIGLLVVIALILGIVGGDIAGSDYSNTGKFTYQIESKISVILFIVSYALIVLAVLYTWFSHGYIEAGEKRLLFVITVSLPVLLVRLIYSCFSNFDTSNPKWNILTGSSTLLLCLAVIEEFIIVVLYEACGLTLKKIVKNTSVPVYSSDGPQYSEQQQQQQQQQTQQHSSGLAKFGSFLATYTIIGRLISGNSRPSRRSRRSGPMPLSLRK